MMSDSESEREVGKALLQLDSYLKALRLPLTVKDLYRSAYKHRLGVHYNEQWLDWLEHDPDILSSLEEPFTLQSILETLAESDHKPILFALVRYAHRHDIGFSYRYVIGIAQE